MAPRCSAKTQAGKRCKNGPQEGSEFCSVHQPPEHIEKKIARIRDHLHSVPRESITHRKSVVDPYMEYYALADDSKPKKPYLMDEILRLNKREENVGTRKVVKFKSPYSHTYVRAYKIVFPENVQKALFEYDSLDNNTKMLIAI